MLFNPCVNSKFNPKQNEKEFLFSVYKNDSLKQAVKNPKFKVGDKVRISKFKHMFLRKVTRQIGRVKYSL